MIGILIRLSIVMRSLMDLVQMGAIILCIIPLVCIIRKNQCRQIVIMLGSISKKDLDIEYGKGKVPPGSTLQNFLR